MKQISTVGLALVLCPFSLFAQNGTDCNVWRPFEYFIGSWQGHEEGTSGTGKGSRTYEFVVGEQYLFSKNLSVFEPQEKNPEGETHEDWTFFSYDKNRAKFIVRQFNSEGFVNHFVLESLSMDRKGFVFVSESSENAPPGLRARLRFQIQNENEFSEFFELAFPGKDFTLLLQNHWTRKKD